jgi:hypothetical protein
MSETCVNVMNALIRLGWDQSEALEAVDNAASRIQEQVWSGDHTSDSIDTIMDQIRSEERVH